MKKRKGFTLIEVVVAIAVLSIAMVGIGSAMYTGVKISAKNTKKVDTSVFAGNIIQTLKSRGKSTLITDFKLSDTSLTKSCYCYFDKEDELKTILDAGIDAKSDAKGSFKAGTEQQMKTNELALAGGKKFGAYVNTELSVPFPNANAPGYLAQVTVLKIYVNVVKMKEPDNTDSSLVFYLGR